MKSSALPEFWDCLADLSPLAQKLPAVISNSGRKSPSLKSLAFKRIKSDLWSVRAGSGVRALATIEDGRYLWFWIGAHDEYERLLREL